MYPLPWKLSFRTLIGALPKGVVIFVQGLEKPAVLSAGFPDLMAGRSERMESSLKTSAGETVNDAGGKDVGDEIDVAVHHQLLAYHKE
jgi:hypothetical protein